MQLKLFLIIKKGNKFNKIIYNNSFILKNFIFPYKLISSAPPLDIAAIKAKAKALYEQINAG